MARKSANGIPDRSRIGLYCWFEPLSLRSATGAQRINNFLLSHLTSHGRVNLKQSLQSHLLECISSGCSRSSIGSFWSQNRNTLRQSGFCTRFSNTIEIWSYSETFGGKLTFSQVFLELELTLRARALGNDREVGRLTHEMSPWIDKTRDKPYLVSKSIRRLSMLILMCWLRIKRSPIAFKNILFSFKNIPSAFRNIPSTFGNILSSFRNLPCGFRNFVWIRVGGNRTMDTEATGQGFQAAKEDFRRALEDKFEQSDVFRDMMEALGSWENP